MPETWQGWTQDILGYTPTMTPTNERYVAMAKIQRWIDQGYSTAAIARLWNQGNDGQCVQGINKYGVSYDSCAYEQKIVINYKQN
jgi:hypothetical protein